MSSLRSRRGRSRSRLAASSSPEEFLHQAVGRSEENGVAGFHQAVAQGTQGVGLAGAGQSEGQHVDAALDEAALGQVVQLLAQGQRHPVVLDSLPGLARGEPGPLTQPVDAPVAAVLGLLLQHLQEDGQGIAVAGSSETGHRLGAHRGQLELAAQLTDAFLHDAGVDDRHAHTPAGAKLTVSRRSYIFRSGWPDRVSSGASGTLGSARSRTCA